MKVGDLPWTNANIICGKNLKRQHFLPTVSPQTQYGHTKMS